MALTNAERQERLRKRKRESGLKLLHVWIRPEREEELRLYEKRLQKPKK